MCTTLYGLWHAVECWSSPFHFSSWRECKEDRATKCVQDLSSLEYDERLVTLKLPTLSYRRHRADMIMVYNILQGNVNLQPGLFFHLNLSSATRGHDFKLFKPHAQKNVRSKFFSVTKNHQLME